jgi:transposase
MNVTPEDLETLRSALIAAEARADAAEAEAARAKASSDQALIGYLKLEIEKLRRDLYGVRSERKARLLDQLELQLEELEATAAEDELAAERAAAKTTTVEAVARRKPARKPFPLPRERVVVPAPATCPAAVRTSCASWARRLPRRWRAFRASGR